MIPADDPIDYWLDKNRHELNGCEARLELASKDYAAASALASGNGLVLERRGDMYTLMGMGWRINLYPASQRIHSPRNCRGPYLHVSKDWRLGDVVQAACGNHN